MRKKQHPSSWCYINNKILYLFSFHNCSRTTRVQFPCCSRSVRKRWIWNYFGVTGSDPLHGFKNKNVLKENSVGNQKCLDSWSNLHVWWNNKETAKTQKSYFCSDRSSLKKKKSYWSQKETDRSGGSGYWASPGDTDGLESAVITCHHARWQLFLYTAGLRRVLWRTNDSRAVAGWSCNDLLDQTTGK